MRCRACQRCLALDARRLLHLLRSDFVDTDPLRTQQAPPCSVHQPACQLLRQARCHLFYKCWASAGAARAPFACSWHFLGFPSKLNSTKQGCLLKICSHAARNERIQCIASSRSILRISNCMRGRCRISCVNPHQNC